MQANPSHCSDYHPSPSLSAPAAAFNVGVALAAAGVSIQIKPDLYTEHFCLALQGNDRASFLVMRSGVRKGFVEEICMYSVLSRRACIE